MELGQLEIFTATPYYGCANYCVLGLNQDRENKSNAEGCFFVGIVPRQGWISRVKQCVHYVINSWLWAGFATNKIIFCYFLLFSIGLLPQKSKQAGDSKAA